MIHVQHHMLGFVGFPTPCLGAGKVPFYTAAPWRLPLPIKRRAHTVCLSPLVKVCIDAVQTHPQGKGDVIVGKEEALISHLESST